MWIDLVQGHGPSKSFHTKSQVHVNAVCRTSTTLNNQIRITSHSSHTRNKCQKSMTWWHSSEISNAICSSCRHSVKTVNCNYISGQHVGYFSTGRLHYAITVNGPSCTGKAKRSTAHGTSTSSLLSYRISRIQVGRSALSYCCYW